jgi:hypothetical protein
MNFNYLYLVFKSSSFKMFIYFSFLNLILFCSLFKLHFLNFMVELPCTGYASGPVTMAVSLCVLCRVGICVALSMWLNPLLLLGERIALSYGLGF